MTIELNLNLVRALYELEIGSEMPGHMPYQEAADIIHRELGKVVLTEIVKYLDGKEPETFDDLKNMIKSFWEDFAPKTRHWK